MTGLEESGQHITEPLVALRGLETRTAGRGLWRTQVPSLSLPRGTVDLSVMRRDQLAVAA